MEASPASKGRVASAALDEPLTEPDVGCHGRRRIKGELGAQGKGPRQHIRATI